MRASWVWPSTILLSALLTVLVTFIVPEIVVRPLIVMWFLFVCPGMVLVRFIDLHEPVMEWVLAIALSLTIDAIVAGILLYTGLWSIVASLWIVIGLCLVGATIQLIGRRFNVKGTLTR